MKMYRTGIIGTGFIGKVHLETVRRLGCVEVVALADKFLANHFREMFYPSIIPNIESFLSCCFMEKFKKA